MCCYNNCGFYSTKLNTILLLFYKCALNLIINLILFPLAEPQHASRVLHIKQLAADEAGQTVAISVNKLHLII